MTEVELINLLDKYNKAYREGKPLVSDAVYDKVFDSTKQLYPNNPFFQTVGMLGEGHGSDVELEYKMGSLRKYHFFQSSTCEDYEKALDVTTYLSKYDNKSGWVVTDKIDGLSAMVTFYNGKIDHAELRGDGEIGTEVTDKVKVILKNIEVPFTKMVVRGEIILDADPKVLGLKSRRNAAAGIVKREDFKSVEYLKIFFYDLIELKMDENDILPQTEFERLSLITKAKLFTPRALKFNEVPYLELSNILNELALGNTVKGIPPSSKVYETDGMVISPDNYVRENSLLPDMKVAFKKQADIRITTCTDVVPQVSRRGVLVPVVYFESVELAGATLSKASASNYGFIRQNNLGIGSKIAVSRSQEVIPYIETVVSGKNAIIPDSCPSCSGPVAWDFNNVHIVCNNIICPAKVLKKISYFFITMGVENFSETTFEKLNVNDVFEVYKLTVDDLLKIDSFGQKSSVEFVNQIKKTLNAKPALLLRALGIPFLGRTVSKLLVDNFDWIIIKNAKLTKNDLVKLEGISVTKAMHIIEGLDNNVLFIKRLEDIGMSVNTDTSGLKLHGKSFAITGKLSKPRKEIEAIIDQNGGTNTSIKKIEGMYLVCNELSSSEKCKKAQSLGVPVISEEQLYAMVN